MIITIQEEIVNAITHEDAIVETVNAFDYNIKKYESVENILNRCKKYSLDELCSIVEEIEKYPQFTTRKGFIEQMDKEYFHACTDKESTQTKLKPYVLVYFCIKDKQCNFNVDVCLINYEDE